MATQKGLFDTTAVADGWFDETRQAVGWFDADLLDTAAAPAPTFLAAWAVRSNVVMVAGGRNA